MSEGIGAQLMKEEGRFTQPDRASSGSMKEEKEAVKGIRRRSRGLLWVAVRSVDAVEGEEVETQ